MDVWISFFAQKNAGNSLPFRVLVQERMHSERLQYVVMHSQYEMISVANS